MLFSTLSLFSIIASALAAPVTQPRAVQVDLSGTDLMVRDTEVDLGGVDLGVRDTEVDLGGVDLGVRQLLPGFPKLDLGVIDKLKGICAGVNGVMVAETVCETATGTDIKVSAASTSGLALVTVSGAGLLQGASITVPIESLESVLGQLA